MIKRYLYIFMCLSLLPFAAKAEEQPVIVELFTSQGCAACPGASTMITKMANENKNIVPFVWAVDYWDYLGWQDTMAIEASGKRQEDFNQTMQKNGVYTPQVIINGEVQAIGSREGEIRNLIKEQNNADTKTLKLSLNGNLDNLSLSIEGVTKEYENAVVSLIWFKNQESVKIVSGDNRGQLFHYTNVVKGVHEYGDLSNPEEYLAKLIKLNQFNLLDANCIAIMVQDGVGGKIIGFTKTTLAELAG